MNFFLTLADIPIGKSRYIYKGSFVKLENFSFTFLNEFNETFQLVDEKLPGDFLHKIDFNSFKKLRPVPRDRRHDHLEKLELAKRDQIVKYHAEYGIIFDEIEIRNKIYFEIHFFNDTKKELSLHEFQILDQTVNGKHADVEDSLGNLRVCEIVAIDKKKNLPTKDDYFVFVKSEEPFISKSKDIKTISHRFFKIPYDQLHISELRLEYDSNDVTRNSRWNKKQLTRTQSQLKNAKISNSEPNPPNDSIDSALIRRTNITRHYMSESLDSENNKEKLLNDQNASNIKNEEFFSANNSNSDWVNITKKKLISSKTVENPTGPLFFASDVCSTEAQLSRGIQGDSNSCYMDSTLTSMFLYNLSFDVLLNPNTLLENADRDNDEKFEQVRRELAYKIVYSLRSEKLVSFDHMKDFRENLQSLKIGQYQGLTNEEKDPEELINMFSEAFIPNDKFLKLIHKSAGKRSASLHQIFFDYNLRREQMDFQKMIDFSLFENQLMFDERPMNLIIQLPRHGADFKVMQKIAPSIQINLTHHYQKAPVFCVECRSTATQVCLSCGIGKKIVLCFYCEEHAKKCAKSRHKLCAIPRRSASSTSTKGGAIDDDDNEENDGRDYDATRDAEMETNVSTADHDSLGAETFYVVGSKSVPPQKLSKKTTETAQTESSSSSSSSKQSKRNRTFRRQKTAPIKMELRAVLCIERSHYVSLIRSHDYGKRDNWVFYDSMADRDQSDTNLPRVVECGSLYEYLQPEIKKPHKFFDRMNQDAFVCFYVDPSQECYV